MNYKQSLKETILLVMARNNLNYTQVAKSLDMTTQNLRNIISKDGNLSLKQMYKLNQLYDICATMKDNQLTFYLED